jgi:hypothetical protein
MPFTLYLEFDLCYKVENINNNAFLYTNQKKTIFLTQIGVVGRIYLNN